jgi:hypothetical protein
MDRERAIETIRKLRMRTCKRGAEHAEEEQAATLASVLQRKYAITEAELESPQRKSLEEALYEIGKKRWQAFLEVEAESARPGWPWDMNYEQLFERKCCYVGGCDDEVMKASGLEFEEFHERTMKVLDAILKAEKPWLAKFRAERKAQREKEKAERAERKARKRQKEVLFDV